MLKPMGQCVKITGKRGKATYGLRITIGAHCDEQLTRSDIYPGASGCRTGS